MSGSPDHSKLPRCILKVIMSEWLVFTINIIHCSILHSKDLHLLFRVVGATVW